MKTIDPVCGMQVDTEITAIWTEYRGQAYYFCKRACQKAFDANPENYVTRRASVAGHNSQDHPTQH